MMLSTRALLTLSLLTAACADPHAAVAPRAHAQASPYVEQRDSGIRGLSAQEIDDLRNGRGMGLARAAELNSHPGPRHVLKLAAPLGIDAERAAELSAIVSRMSADARALGAEILAQEEALSRSFAEHTVNAASLAAQTESLGIAYGKLRARHLAAHVETRDLLTPAQIAQYDVLRGYVTTSGDAGGMPSGHAAHH